MSSLMRSYHHVTRFNPFDACRIADVGDVRFQNIYNLDEAIKDIEHFYRRLHDAGVTPLAVGGELIPTPGARSWARSSIMVRHFG